MCYRPGMSLSQTPPLLLLLGGSFNPPHSGHFRIAIETAEAVGSCQTLFIPCAVPPHKQQEVMLPFAYRCALLQAGIDDMKKRGGPGARLDFAVSEVEAERPGPSYTVDTLEVLTARYPSRRLAFVLGSEDYSRLNTWVRWRRLPELADLIVLPRRDHDERFFPELTASLWPEATFASSPYVAASQMAVLQHGGRVLYLPQPVLDISSSLVRQRFLQDRSLDFLVPAGVERLLREKAPMLKEAWAADI